MHDGPNDEGRELYEYRYGEPPLTQAEIDDLLADLPDEVTGLPPGLQGLPVYTQVSALQYLDGEQVARDVARDRPSKWGERLVLYASLGVVAGIILAVAGILTWRYTSNLGVATDPGRVDVQFLAETSVGDMVDMCDHMSGELIFDDTAKTWTCEDVRK